jgi:hypothetical protein
VPSIIPTLIQPSDRQQVDSIAPTLSWTPGITGTFFLVQVATAPGFAVNTIEISATKSLRLGVRDTQFRIPSNNFEAEATYYWRVGVLLPEGMSFSPVAQFTTAAMDATRLPSSPTLLTPGDDERIKNLDPVFTWAAAEGADAYRVKVVREDQKTSYKTSSVIEAPRTDYSPTGFDPKSIFYWQVKVHNSYGWGEYGPIPPRRLRTP